MEKEDPPYRVGFSASDIFYTSGGGVVSDVNGNGKVNIIDAGGISAHWYIPSFISGSLGYDSNFDIYPELVPNGIIATVEAALVSAHWDEEVGGGCGFEISKCIKAVLSGILIVLGVSLFYETYYIFLPNLFSRIFEILDVLF